MQTSLISIVIYFISISSQIPGEVKSEASLAGRKTIETVKCVSLATPSSL